MADDDKDFTFGDVGEDFSGDDGWGSLEDDADGTGEPGGDFDLDAMDRESAPAVPQPSPEPVIEEKPPAAMVEEPAAETVKRSSSRMVLYGLLVMVLSAAGFYYFTTSPSPPAAAKRPAETAKQTLAMPERPESSTGSAMPTGETVQIDGKPVLEAEIPKGTLREVLPTDPAPVPATVETKLAVPEPAVISPPAQALPEKNVQVTEVARKKTPVVAKKPVAAGKYYIQAGAFVDYVNRDEALAKIRQIGFEGKVEPLKKIMPMTRLLVGVYAPDVAKQKAAELAKVDQNVFYLQRGDQLAVYAGSFYEIGKARAFADGLLQKGITVEEEKTEVELTLSRLKFGSFPDLSTAEKAAKQARSIGLEAEIVRNHR